MASEYDIAQAAAGIYAESLLQLAADANQIEAFAEELAGLETLWRAEPAFAAMMSSAAIDRDARRESLKRVFTGKLSKLVLNLLLVLNDKHRAIILPAVIDAYRRKFAQRMDRQTVYVASAVALDDADRNRLRAEVKRLTGREAVLSERVDLELLGGMTVQMGDRLYDTSVRHRLLNLRRSLLASIESHMLQGTARFVTEG